MKWNYFNIYSLSNVHYALTSRRLVVQITSNLFPFGGAFFSRTRRAWIGE